MMEKKSVGFFDLKRNLVGILSIVALITVAGWYFGFGWSDVRDVAESAATAAKPALPIEVSYRESMFGQGYVAIIRNISEKSLPVQIDLRDPRAVNKKQESKELDPNQNYEIGWLEGWEFKAGDVIKVSNPAYQTGVYAIK